jgi:hypothetical protein
MCLQLAVLRVDISFTFLELKGTKLFCFLSTSATHFPRALCTKCRQNCAVYNDSLTNCPATDARLSHLMTVPCTVVGEKSGVFLRRSRRALILKDPKVLHCFVHKDQPVGQILTWFNTVLLFIPYFWMTQFDIIGQSTPRFPILSSRQYFLWI